MGLTVVISVCCISLTVLFFLQTKHLFDGEYSEVYTIYFLNGQLSIRECSSA